MSFKETLKNDFSSRTLVLIPIMIAINMAIGQIVSLIKLPIFLDSIGTVFIALLCGPWVGLLTGFLTNIIWGMITSPVAAAFSPVAAVIGLAAGFCASAGLFRNWWKVILSGIIIGAAASITAIPIRVYMFGGITGSGADFVTAYLLALGKDLFSSVIATVLISNIPDKIVTALIAWLLILGLSERFKARFPRTASIIKSNKTE